MSTHELGPKSGRKGSVDAAPGPTVKRWVDVAGDCPACGHPVLMLGEGGYVTCSLIDCPDPEAVVKLLRLPREVLMRLIEETPGTTPPKQADPVALFVAGDSRNMAAALNRIIDRCRVSQVRTFNGEWTDAEMIPPSEIIEIIRSLG